MESSEEEYKNWEVLIRKAIAAEKKTRGWPTLLIKEVDQYYPQGHRPSLQANKHQQEKEQGQDNIKDPRQQELKSSSLAAQPHQCNEANQSKGKNFWRDKKLRCCQKQK